MRYNGYEMGKMAKKFTNVQRSGEELKVHAKTTERATFFPSWLDFIGKNALILLHI